MVIILEASRFAAGAVWNGVSATTAARALMIDPSFTKILGRCRGVSVQKESEFPICVPDSPQLVTYPLRNGAAQLNLSFYGYLRHQRLRQNRAQRPPRDGSRRRQTHRRDQ